MVVCSRLNASRGYGEIKRLTHYSNQLRDMETEGGRARYVAGQHPLHANATRLNRQYLVICKVRGCRMKQ